MRKEQIKKLLKKPRMTQAIIARELGITRQLVYWYIKYYKLRS